MKSLVSWASRHRILLALAAFSALFFSYTYLLQPNRPGAYPDPKISWNYWHDQGAYLKETRAIHSLGSNPADYGYLFGYPLLAAPFAGILHNDPFFVINLVVFVFVIVMTKVISDHLLGRPWGLLVAGSLLLATPLTFLTVVPWTTTATLPAIIYLMYLVFVKDRFSYLDSTVLALLFVLAYMARGGGEVFVMVPLGLSLLWKFRKEPQIWSKTALAAAILAVGVIGNGLWTKAIFGSYIHPYVRYSALVGFNLRRIPRSFWGTIVFSGRIGQYAQPLLGGAFLFVLAPFGMIIGLMDQTYRWLHLGMIASMALGFGLITSYNQYSAATLIYSSLHYLKIWFPALTLYAIMAVVWLLRSGREVAKGHAPRRSA